MFFLYSFLYTIAIIFLLPYEYLKRPKEIRKRWLKEKCGYFNAFSGPHSSSLIWVHAVSVGEVMAALPLIKKLRERYPSKQIVLSTITDTGQKVAREQVSAGTAVVYLPFDIPFILKNVLMQRKSDVLLIIETELWPNLCRVFKENRVPVMLMNGRISEKSFGGYKKLSFFMRKALSYIDVFCMQSADYAERIRLLGVESSRIAIAGNFKFDTRPPAEMPAWTKKIRGPVIVAGSTHDGEEELLASVYVSLLKDIPDLNLVIAPRHPERFGHVAELLRSKKYPFIKRSGIATQSGLDTLQGTIILLDTVGELSAVYGIGDIAVIGKSFRGYGGQNPLEPAYWGKPIICGPHMENFPVTKDFHNAGAVLIVEEGNLYAELSSLLRSPEKAQEIGAKALVLYRKNEGAVERAMKIIAPYLDKQDLGK
jgi:3-deoxy-D-manno-octulosonic-acid transferase